MRCASSCAIRRRSALGVQPALSRRPLLPQQEAGGWGEEGHDIRVLFMSGYTEHATVQHDKLAAGSALLQKPFAASELVRMVRAVLDA